MHVSRTAEYQCQSQLCFSSINTTVSSLTKIEVIDREKIIVAV
jgi:hypothetical protein